MRWLAGILILIAAAADAAEVDLSSPAKYQFGDWPHFADPGFDDSAWPEADLASRSEWVSLGAGPEVKTKWERIRFNVEDPSTIADPSIQMGVVRGGEEVWLNGERIGQRNLLSPLIEAFPVQSTRSLPRIYKIPDGIMRKGENVLAIRQFRFGVDTAGVLAGPFRITSYSEAFDSNAERLTRFLAISVVLLTFSTAVVVVVWTIIAFGGGSARMWWLALVTTMFLPTVILGAGLAVAFGYSVHAMFHIYAFKLAAASIAPLLSFAAASLNIRPGPVTRVLQIAHLALFLTPPVAPGPISEFLWLAYLLWALCAVVSFVLIIIWCVRSLKSGVAAAYPMLLGVGALTLGVAIDLTPLNTNLALATGQTATDIASAVFVASLLLMAGVAHRETSRRLSTAQSSILKAHEQERRRIAHDVHDGVGQWLTTIKLNLQMLRSRQGGDEGELTDVVRQIDEAISDTRRIAHDLSPAMIRREGLAAAMRSHGDIVSQRGGVEVIVEADDAAVLDAEVQGHLYRIFQEALTNAIRHGRADRIEARLTIDDRRCTLSVTDNGSGFEDVKTGRGMGLDSIRERATLLSADCSIRSGVGAGATVKIEFET